MTVRSRRIFGPTAVTSATAVSLYTVPAGRTAVFRLIMIVMTSGAGGNVALRINSSTGNNVFFATITVGAPAEVLNDLVLNPGDVLWAVIPASHTVTFTGCGSLLDGEPE
jgi:hypothetical protein